MVMKKFLFVRIGSLVVILGIMLSAPVIAAPAPDSKRLAAAKDYIADEQWNRAIANLTGARDVAKNTPIEVSAAKTAAQQATARYEAGLGNIDAVAEAQRLVTQAEIDDALARLGVWRGLLGVAAAAGDIRPSLAEVGR